MGKINNLSYISSLDYNINGSKSICDWASSSDIRLYKDYLMNSHYQEINEALRNDTGLDIFRIMIVDGIDRIFNSMPESYCSKKDEIVYRGISIENLPKEISDIITKKTNKDVFTDKGFVSTSKKRHIAKNFRGENGILLEINLPRGSKRLNASDVFDNGEEEMTLPRNSQFRVESYDPQTRVAKLTYLGQKGPLPTIRESSKLESELDEMSILYKKQFNSKLNKSNVNKNFTNLKY